MKKINKKDMAYLGILVIGTTLLMLSYTRLKYVYGSTTDWREQHCVIPDCFRRLFYHTGQPFPSFLPNSGAGQNIYYYSYYGLFSPVILISYLLPSVSMQDYIIASSIMIVYISVMLVYIWIRGRYSADISFISAFMFMCASPLVFHSHRHIMFINYFPFLISAFICIDKGIKGKKQVLFSILLFLMIMTSYFFSFSALIFLTVYAVAVYLEKRENKIFSKSFLVNALKYIYPLIAAVMLSGVLLLPAASVLVSGRGADGMPEDIIKMIAPGLNLEYIIYSPYSAGVTFIGLISFLTGLSSKNIRIRILSFTVVLITTFSGFLYLLNGTLYVDGKVTIPFLPAAVIIIADMLKRIKSGETNYTAVIVSFIWAFTNILFMRTPEYIPLFLTDVAVTVVCLISVSRKGMKIYRLFPMLGVMCFLCVFVNRQDASVLVKHETFENSVQKIADSIPADENNIYRTANMVDMLENVNKIYNDEYFQTTVYSSASNPFFHKFYLESIGNETRYRNSSIMSPTPNIIYNMYMANRYMICKECPPVGYEKNLEEDGIKLYENSDAFPLAYSSGKLMSLSEYEKLTYPQNIEAILSCAVVDDDTLPASGFTSSVQPWKPKYSIDSHENEGNIKKCSSVYYINNKSEYKVSLKLEKPLENKIVFIRFHVDNSNNPMNEDVYIKINQIKNKLTNKNWKYYNNNEWFEYVVSSAETINNIDITFSKGEYSVSDIRMYTLDYSAISELKDTFDIMSIDKAKTSGDVIVGTVNMKNDGLLQMSVPYDKGFSVYIDGGKSEYRIVDSAFIGFDVKKGTHSIKVEFEAPLRKEGLVCSSIGVMMLVSEIIYCIFMNRKDKISVRSKNTR